MDNSISAYFINSSGEQVVLSSDQNNQYWELVGRSGFTAPEVENFTEKFASGQVKYFGKALKPRSCSMRMVCCGKDTAERDRVFFNMVNILIDKYGTKEGKLYIRRSDGGMVYLNCVYSGGMNIVEQYKKFHIFTIEFYAVNPWFYIDTGISHEFNVRQEKTVTVIRPDDYDIVAEFICGGAYGDEATISGIITNETAGKKIQFAYDSSTIVIPTVPQNSKLHLELAPEYKISDIEYTNGETTSGASFVNWMETDRAFSFADNENIVKFEPMTGVSGWGYGRVTMNIKYRCIGA